MKAIDFLYWCRAGADSDVFFEASDKHLWRMKGGGCCPGSQEGEMRGKPSNSELRRWLKNGAVIVNGQRPKPGDTIEWPITELVFFPSGIQKTTIA